METKAKRIPDPFQGYDRDASHSSKTILFRRNSKDKRNPFVAMVHTYKNSKRPEAWGFPGGSQHGWETPKETAVRELKGEAGIVITPNAFPEVWQRPPQIIKSDRPGEPKFHKKHWFFGFLTDDMGNVPITETDEVIERGFLLLNEIPLPDYSWKNGVPSLLSHIQMLELQLIHIEHMVEDADLWLENVQDRFGSYLRR